MGMDAGILEEVRSALSEGTFQNTNSLLVIKDGQLVFEAYPGELGGNDLHYVASVTKSVSTLLLGIAMDRGLLPGIDEGALDTPLSELIPEYAEALNADPLRARITLRDVLSMRGGLAWDEDSHPYDDPRNDWVRVRDAEDPMAVIFQQPMVAEPGEAFAYSGGMSTVVGYLLEKATGGAPHRFAEEELFEPLGIDHYEWWDLEGGIIDAPGGLHLRPRDMAKIGQVMLNGGIWDGRRIVSEDWVRETSRRHLTNPEDPDYALHWWCGDFHYRGRSTFLYMASGHGGQKIYVIPEFDMVVVLTHQVFDNPFGELNNLVLMGQYVLPAADPLAAADTVQALSEEDLAVFAGVYSDARGTFVVEAVDGSLRVMSEGSPTLTLEPVGPNRFRGLVNGLLEAYFEFQLDAEGMARTGRFTFGFREDVYERVG